MIPEWVKRVCRAWPLSTLGDCDTIFLPCVGEFVILSNAVTRVEERVEINMHVLVAAGRNIEVYSGRSAALDVVVLRSIIYTGSVVKRSWSAEESKHAAVA